MAVTRVFAIQTRPANHYEPVRPAPANWLNRPAGTKGRIQFTMPFGTDATTIAFRDNPASSIPIEILGEFASAPGVFRSLDKATWTGGKKQRDGVTPILPQLGWETEGEMPINFKAVADTPVAFDWGLDVDATVV